MGSPVTVCNLALAEVGHRGPPLSILNDGTPAGNAAGLFYTPKTQMLMRAAPWDSLRAQLTLSLFRATVINGVVQVAPNLPPQPWQFEYLYPSDCLKLRFIQPTLNPPINPPLTTAPNNAPISPRVPTGIPFVVATDFDANNNPIKVILTNLPNAQAVYVRDLSQYPDLWDPMFLAAETATLGAYFINALMRNKADLETQIQMAKQLIGDARAANANESISSIDNKPDWMQVRTAMPGPWAWENQSPSGVVPGAWDLASFPGGMFF